MIKMLRELNSYTTYIQKAVTNISICTAIAETDLQRNQRVGLVMKNGLLFATANKSHGATGTAISDARSGEDIGITGIEGIVPMQIGKVTILKIPGIQKGGSNNVNYAGLKKHLSKSPFTASIGIESFAALQKIGVGFCCYGAAGAAIEAAHSGLSPFVACVDDMISTLLTSLQEQNVNYEIIDLTRNN
jgi:putative transcriptional regulator